MKKLKFALPSLLGFLFFLVPFEINGENKIAISHILAFVKQNHMEAFLLATKGVAWIVIAGSVLMMLHTSKYKILNDLFKTNPLGTIVRTLGSLLYLMVINQWFYGARWASFIHDPNTGGVMVGANGLLTTLYMTFLLGLLFLPLLTHFGAVEFIGIVIGKFVERVFKVPGYSAVDAIASFVGDGTIGILVTDMQYQRGYYNRREAYVIATSFSIVGIAFATAVAEELGLSDIFPLFYGTILLITVVIALITTRLPLKKFEALYYNNQSPKKMEIPEKYSTFKFALISAEKAAGSVHLIKTLKNSFISIANTYIGFLPVIMLVGTLSLILAEHTAIFTLLSAPLVPLYELMGFGSDSAILMAPATIVGLADMYLPALFIADAASESAKFFIGVLAFTQLVFMSETGMILVKSKIGLSLLDVIKIFFYRTALSIPLLLLITKLYGFR